MVGAGYAAQLKEDEKETCGWLGDGRFSDTDILEECVA